MKKIIVSQEHLKTALKKLGQAVSSKPVSPVLSNILCRVRNTEVELITTDLELTIIYRCPADATGGSFEFLLPFDFIKKVVSLTPHIPIIIEHPAETKATIIAGLDTYALKSLEKVETFPKLPDIPKKNSIKLTEAVMQRVRASIEACSKDEARPAMMYSCLDIKEGTITIAGTDGLILYNYKVPCEKGIPTDQVLISQKLTAALDGEGDAELYWHSKHAAFKTQSMTVVITRHEHKYPNYRSVIPNHLPNLHLERNELINNLMKAEIANPGHCTLNLKKAEGAVLVTARDEELERDIEAPVTAAYTGKTELVAVNPQKLIKLLSQVEYNKVALHIDTARRAVLVTSEEDEAYLGLIMPLNIDN